jgi:hypothetical protein
MSKKPTISGAAGGEPQEGAPDADAVILKKIKNIGRHYGRH